MKLVKLAGIALAGVVCTSFANAVLVYDSIGAGSVFTTTTGGLPRNRMADEMVLLDPAGFGGTAWAVTSIDFGMFVNPNAFANVSAEVILWNEWNGAGFGGGVNVFQNEAGRETFNFGAIAASGLQTVTFTAPIALSAFSNVGIEIQLRGDGTQSDNLALSLQDAAPVVGTSTNLFYRDANSNAIVETTDGRTISGWTNSNTMMRINATPVPEPASLAIMGMGALALLRRRRK